METAKKITDVSKRTTKKVSEKNNESSAVSRKNKGNFLESIKEVANEGISKIANATSRADQVAEKYCEVLNEEIGSSDTTEEQKQDCKDREEKMINCMYQNAETTQKNIEKVLEWVAIIIGFVVGAIYISKEGIPSKK